MTENTYDLGIIGGGPAGYTAALHAKASGLSVVMFEKDKVGGVCLNRGCIPTKAILHSAEVYEDLKCSSDIGINCEGLSVDFAKVVERKERTVEKLRKSLELTLKNAGVVTVIARAEVAGQNKIKANGELYECSKIIVATGSSPRALKGIEFDNEFVLSSDDVLNLTSLPKSIAIIGSGAIGIEWARIFSAFDVEVTIIEAAEHLCRLLIRKFPKGLNVYSNQKKLKCIFQTVCKKLKIKKFIFHRVIL